MRAKSNIRNNSQLLNVFESLSRFRKAEAEITALTVDKSFSDDDLMYLDMYACGAGDGYIHNLLTAYRDPISDMVFHSKTCAEEWGMMS